MNIATDTMTESPGMLLRAKRTEHNMSQEQVADKLGVSMSSVNRWERGSRSPQPTEAARLQDIFGIPVTAWSNSLSYRMAATFRKVVCNVENVQPVHYAVCSAVIATESNYVFSSNPEEIYAMLGRSVEMDVIESVMSALVKAGVFVERDGGGYSLSV